MLPTTNNPSTQNDNAVVGEYSFSRDGTNFKACQLKPNPRMRASYLFRRTVGKTLKYTPGAEKFLELSNRVITKLQNALRTEKSVDRYLKLLATNDQNAHTFDSGYGYEDEIWEINAAIQYYNEVHKNILFSNDLFQRLVNIISAIKEKEPSVKKFLDFGVSYGYLIAELGKTYPDIQATGIDRSKLTKIFNESLFHDIPNVQFESGDVFDTLINNDFTGGCFLHTRTLSLLPPNFITRLYKQAFDSGFKYILGAEHWGTSWQTGKPMSLSQSKQDSVLFRNHMFLHNYPEFLLRANYQIEWAEIRKAINHPDPNLHIFIFLAKRRD